jgi:F-type H+-transporting ATPase subunit epsilon
MHLEVLTPSKIAVDQEVDEVVVPGAVGELGVLPGHIPLLTALKPGTLTWRGKTSSGTLTIGPGYCEVDGKDRIVVLTNSVEKPNAADKA